MEINEFLEKFVELFDDTDLSVLRPDTKFRELDEWSSLSALGLLALADEEYYADLDANDIRKAETIADLFEIIKNKSND